MESYIEYCKAHIIDHLENMKGWDNEEYGADLGSKLTEGINIDGSATCSTYEAKEYIKAWYDEAGEVYEYQKDNYGEVLHNPFEEPEAFHVCMVIEGVNNILAQCKTVEAHWNDQIKLTNTMINRIIKEVKTVESIKF